jgi:H+/Cl- antiporter ClcA
MSLATFVLKWLLVCTPVGAAVGSAVALFLWSLDLATRTRWDHPWLLFLLPVAGVAVGAMYHLVGKSVETGNNLIIEQIHEPGGGVPTRMAPLVLIGTILTHLFGGSAGREGTAVQMGGSIASTLARWLRLRDDDDVRILLMAGVAAGFGAVFGTPLTGAVFAIEVLALGQMSYAALVPCLIASIAGDAATTAWGIHHTQYSIASFVGHDVVRPATPFNGLLAGKVAVASIAFGLASVLFAELTHSLSWAFKRLIPWPILRPAVGGGIIIALVYALGTRAFLGLGVTADPHHPGDVSIVSAFHPGGATYFSWWWKILFTAVTLSSGFKGGEVTPLFFVGATLGNTMSRILHAPPDLFAALGFVAVFAGATNTPLACTIMGIELFAAATPGLVSSGFVVYLAIACFLSYLLSGHSGVYLSQRIGTPKLPLEGPTPSLREARSHRPHLWQRFPRRH